jgi:hypothetical protein
MAKVYTDENIQSLLSGYMLVNNTFWDYIPAKSHIRYIKKDSGDNLPKNERFKLGGFVKNHFMSNGKKILAIENIPGGGRYNNNREYITYPLPYDDIEVLWKKIDCGSFIEIHLVNNSLAQKTEQIKELERRIKVLEDILKKAVIK